MRLPTLAVASVVTAMLLTPALGQTVDKEMILHPGDTIEFKPLDDHAVRFGGTVTDSTNASVTLTAFPDVLKLLDFPVPATCQPANVSCSVFPPATHFTARVRADIDFATLGAATSFDFTCGVHTDMIARKFTVEPVANPAVPVRKLVITTNQDFQWILQEDVVLNKDHPGHN
jgi:hypothetical protein